MVLIDGKKTSEIIQAEIADEVIKIKNKGGKIPHLAAILVGHDGGSETYVAGKVKACERVGFKSTLIRYDDNVTEEELLNCVTKLNNDADLDGFIVQLPLPKHISEYKVVEAINPCKMSVFLPRYKILPAEKVYSSSFVYLLLTIFSK